MTTETDKARVLRSNFVTIINEFTDEGRHDLAHQTTKAIADVPDSSMAKLYDILQQVVCTPATVGSPEEGPVISVITEVRVPWENIINAFIGVCETSACTYWLSKFWPLEPECSGLVASCREAKDPWYATLDFWGKGGRAILTHDDPNNDDQQTNTIIGETEIISGLNAMANKCPKHFADLVSENDDAITHDVMIQCIVFGEIIYG